MASCAPATLDALVIGGGYFGCRLALALAERGKRVTLVEREPELLRRASYHNQARVHGGYHYPRSVLTALRSRVNFPRFRAEYRDCIDEAFVQLYAVARTGSKVSARQFVDFCRRIGAPVEPAARELRRLFNGDLVEDVFVVQEVAFDAAQLAKRLTAELDAARVEVRLGTRAMRVAGADDGLCVELAPATAESELVRARRVFNCTYSALNELLAASGLPLIALKHEMAEMALIDVPEPLRGVGVTVMDGPFFSLMPFPSRGLHTLSHVRYTPHFAWRDDAGTPRPELQPPARVDSQALTRGSHFVAMRQDARRYLPGLADCRYVESLWEVKTVLPASELDDSRPILFRRDHGLPGFTCVLGGKIDNVYDIVHEIEHASDGS